jgi:hypothetical protein
MKLRSRSVDIPALPLAPPSKATQTRHTRDERVAARAIATPDEERERYVMDLKRRVTEDTYNPTGMEIAEAILAERIADNLVL